MIPEEKLKDRMRDTFWKLCLDSTNPGGAETAFWPEDGGELEKEYGETAEVYLIPNYVDLFCLAYDKNMILEIR